MWRWFQRRPARRDRDPEELALEKRKAELADLKLGVRERELKVAAIQRVVDTEADPLTALEVVAVATHRGRLPPAVYTRRQPQQSPLETLAMGMLQKKLEEDPTDALERILDRRERLEEAADRLSGGRRGEADEATGNTLVDVARAVANSPLGEAIGNVLGAQAQHRMAAAAATSGRGEAPQPVVSGRGAGPDEALGPPAPSAPAIEGPPPVSFRVGMALRVLKSLSPADGARWILSQADQHEHVAELVGPLVSAEPSAVPAILEAFVTEASASADPAVAEWVPLVQHLLEHLEWTLEAHREMRAIALDQVDDDDDLAAGG